MGFNGSYLPLLPLADRELSPQVSNPSGTGLEQPMASLSLSADIHLNVLNNSYARVYL
jgi:hypothetical protein